MTFVLPEGLAPEVYPLAWLVGTWRGSGLLAYPGVPQSAFTAQVQVGSDGGPYLSWSATWWLAPDGSAPVPEAAPVWAAESGWWRVPPVGADGAAAGTHPVELLVADPSGHVAVYLGSVAGARIDLSSDAVLRTATGAQVTGGTRLYGLVDGDLMWAHDLAAFGHPLQSYASATLARVTP